MRCGGGERSEQAKKSQEREVGTAPLIAPVSEDEKDLKLLEGILGCNYSSSRCASSSYDLLEKFGEHSEI